MVMALREGIILHGVTITIPIDFIIPFACGMVAMLFLEVLAYEIDAYLERKKGKIF